MKRAFAVTLLVSVLVAVSGCGGVTYPKETLRESVIELCKKEYDLDVDVELMGHTLAIYLPLSSLLDISLGLTERAQDQIQNVLLGASRVTLSTDADVKFYCVIAQDVRLPEIQMVIIKYTDDIKRAFFNDISRGEYFKRTLIDINENPQSKKENAITEVFEKMNLNAEMQEKVLDDFFRSPPSSLEGIGYWNGKFYMKNITLEEFLAQQMASRIKMGFREKEGLKRHLLKSVTGRYTADDRARFFILKFNAEGLLFFFDPEEKESAEKEIFSDVFTTVADVLYGYKFEDFDLVKAIEENSDMKLFITKEELYLFKKKKLPVDDILAGIIRL